MAFLAVGTSEPPACTCPHLHAHLHAHSYTVRAHTYKPTTHAVLTFCAHAILLSTEITLFSLKEPPHTTRTSVCHLCPNCVYDMFCGVRVGVLFELTFSVAKRSSSFSSSFFFFLLLLLFPSDATTTRRVAGAGHQRVHAHVYAVGPESGCEGCGYLLS